MLRARWHYKADSFVAGWRARYGETPPKCAVVLGLCQPSAETDVGDAWPLDRNWGATTVRRCTAAELAAISAAGVVASVGSDHESRALAAMAALAAAGLGFTPGTFRGVVVPRASLHCDSTTDTSGQHPYFVWFAAFDLDEKGLEAASAAYYLSFVGDVGNPARAVLLNPKAGVAELAAAVYSRGYFWGFKPHGIYKTAGPDGIMGTADDVTHDGNAENVAAYAAWLAPHFATISANLSDWQPSESDHPAAPPAPDAFDLSKPADVQRALNALGCGRPLLKVDGDFGTKSVAALGFYQGACPNEAGDGLIDVTGIVDAPTLAGMKRDLGAIGLEVAP